MKCKQWLRLTDPQPEIWERQGENHLSTIPWQPGSWETYFRAEHLIQFPLKTILRHTIFLHRRNSLTCTSGQFRIIVCNLWTASCTSFYVWSQPSFFPRQMRYRCTDILSKYEWQFCHWYYSSRNARAQLLQFQLWQRITMVSSCSFLLLLWRWRSFGKTKKAVAPSSYHTPLMGLWQFISPISHQALWQ